MWGICGSRANAVISPQTTFKATRLATRFTLFDSNSLPAFLEQALDFATERRFVVRLPPHLFVGSLATRPFLLKLIPGPDGSFDYKDIALEIRDEGAPEPVAVVRSTDYGPELQYRPGSASSNSRLSAAHTWKGFAKLCEMSAACWDEVREVGSRPTPKEWSTRAGVLRRTPTAESETTVAAAVDRKAPVVDPVAEYKLADMGSDVKYTVYRHYTALLEGTFTVSARERACELY
jgi:hypothetical protein